MSPREAAATRMLPVTGFAVLLLLAVSGFASGDAGPVPPAARSAGQDAHVLLYQEHLARLQMIHFSCR